MDKAILEAFLNSSGVGAGANPQDILSYQQASAAQNPFFMAASPILGAKFNTSTWSPTESLAASAAQSFLGTALAGLGQNRQAREMEAVAQALPSLYENPLKSPMPEGVNADAFNAMRGSIYSRQTGAQSQMNQKLLNDLFGVKIAGLTEREKRIAANEVEDARMIPALQIATPADDGGPNLGVKSLPQVEAEIFQNQRAQGIPAQQAAVSARDQVESVRKRGKDLFNTRLTDAQQSIGKMEELIRKGEEGLALAGNTGSALASWYEKAVSTLAPILPGDQAEAIQQAEGDKSLELTQQLGAMIGRITGSGALSDFESKALFATALSPNNTKEQNELILRNYKNGLAVAKEHTAFMNYFADKTGGNPERAQQLWELYKQENPPLAKDSSGRYVVNSDRKPWQKFDFKGAYDRFLKGEIVIAEEPKQSIPKEIQDKFGSVGIKSIRRVR